MAMCFEQIKTLQWGLSGAWGLGLGYESDISFNVLFWGFCRVYAPVMTCSAWILHEKSGWGCLKYTCGVLPLIIAITIQPICLSRPIPANSKGVPAIKCSRGEDSSENPPKFSFFSPCLFLVCSGINNRAMDISGERIRLKPV